MNGFSQHACLHHLLECFAPCCSLVHGRCLLPLLDSRNLQPLRGQGITMMQLRPCAGPETRIETVSAPSSHYLLTLPAKTMELLSSNTTVLIPLLCFGRSPSIPTERGSHTNEVKGLSSISARSSATRY